jgi:multiple sugar transport system permease protein
MSMLVKRRYRSERTGRATAWLMSLPAIVIHTMFAWLPIALAFLVATQKYYPADPPDYIGFENFRNVFEDPMTYTAFRNTLFFAAMALLLTFVQPIIISVMLMEMSRRVVRVMMLLWFLPVSNAAGIVIWKYFYNPELGLFNKIIEATLGPEYMLGWLNDPNLAMLCLVLPGFIMFGPSLIYISVLRSIPDEFYEAAELDGAGFWLKLWHITFPRLRPVIAMMLIFTLIGALQVFDQPFIMTGGGPGDATRTVALYIYDMAFGSLDYGKGTALAVVFFFVIMALVIIQRKFFKEDLDQ